MTLKDFLFIIEMLKINQIANGIPKITEIFYHIVKVQKYEDDPKANQKT